MREQLAANVEALDPPAMTEKIAGARHDLVARALDAVTDAFAAEDTDALDAGMTDQLVAAVASLPRIRRDDLRTELTSLARALPDDLLDRLSSSLVPHLKVGARILLGLASSDNALEEVPA